MLESLDVAIGVTVVMLAFSLAIAGITQLWVSLFNWRGSHLRDGLRSLLQSLEPSLSTATAAAIAVAVLRHGLIRLPGGRESPVIGREELIQVLLALAAESPPSLLAPADQQQLLGLLKRMGIAEPGTTLRDLRMRALQISETQPELSPAGRDQLAMVEEAASEFLAHVCAWFDRTMDRVSQRFTTSTRLVTVIASFILVLLVQLDTVELINRLALEPELRARLLKQGEGLVERGAPVEGPPPAVETSPAAGSNVPRPSSDKPTPSEQADAARPSASDTLFKGHLTDLRTLVAARVIRLPSGDPQEFLRELPGHLFGILLSGILLSFGAPFWYNALRDLLKLRPVLAKKEEERRSRATDAEPPKNAAVTDRLEAVG